MSLRDEMEYEKPTEPRKYLDKKRDHIRKVRAERKRAGLCPECGLRPPTTWPVQCDECNEKRRSYQAGGKERVRKKRGVQ